ncbi:hypothetical protein [Paenibacillus sp. RC67]|uniref:hypothetical protein n=1 Tax=Paenibacillus sp. RC67 TaxID=3039392 RepID=UPI0024ADFD6E|nr:hypothetical protein [Paenibacillus sp. RC67]
MGPTILVFIGLYLLHSVPITFAIFYGWLFLIPIVQKRSTRLSELGFIIQKGNVILGLVLGMISFGVIVIGGAVLSPLLFDADKVRRLLQDWHIDYSYT